MLSVQPLKSAQGAADYYAAAFNYYSGDAQALRWLGKGAEYLGLSGVVEKEQMLQLLEGKLPNGQILQNKKGEHRPGFDMTFSAPKSVSILIGLQADPKLEQLHDLAVERAISAIEKEFAQARVVIDGKVHYVDTGKLVVAAFRQPSSRANDPATHTHGVTMNITITDEDGKARSLASDIHGVQGVVEQLQKYVTYGGLIYRTEYANLLKENNYRLENVGKGLFEIEGFSKEVLREFSTRRVDIEGMMQENGWEGSRMACKATLLTRPPKEEHDIDVLRADWKKRADQLEFNPHEFVKNHKEQTKAFETPGIFDSLKARIFNLFFEKDDLVALASKEAVFVAIETITQQTSVFDERMLKETALRHSLTQKTIVPIDAIEKQINVALKKQELYEAHDLISNKRHFTTPWALTLETETLARIENNKGAVTPISTVHAISKKQEAYESQSSFSLTNSQKNALMHVFLSEDRFNAIQGYAGAGKTTLLQLTTELATEKRFSMRGVAVTSSAVDELRKKAGIDSDVFPIVHQELINAKNNSLKKMIYVLDEASMLSSIQGHELMKLLEQKGARLLLVGDTDQLSSVKCGRIFGQAQDYGIQTTRMTDIIRQNTPMAKQSVHDAIARNLHDSVQKLNQVRELDTHDKRIEFIANQWLNLSSTVRESTLVFAPTHANRQEITQIIREELKKEGVLSGQELLLNTLKAKPMEEIQFHHLQYYQKGDVLRFNLRIPRSQIKAGDYLTIDTFTEKHKANKTVPLITRENKTVLLHLSDLPNYQPTRAGLNRPLEFYEKRELPLCINDRVLITRNNKKAGMENSSLAQIKSIGEQSIILHFEKEDTDREFDLLCDELQHLDHGYVLTNMKVQGKDKIYGLGLMESYQKHSATLRNYYVQISRAITSMTLITDDKTRLLKALEFNDDEKKTALDAVESETVAGHQHRFGAHKRSVSIASVLDKKLDHEHHALMNKELIHHYSSAKEHHKSAPAAKWALEITSNKKTLGLARKLLGYSEATLCHDALKMQTLRLYKSLPDSEQKKMLLVKSYIKSCDQTSRAYKSVHNGNKSPLQQSVAFDHKLRRNELAHQIYESIQEYKPYLSHFSVGALNRLGLPQYQIQKGVERALKRLTNLGEHAKHHQVALTINTFFTTSNLKEKEHIGYLLKNQSKTVHPFLIKQSRETGAPLANLWQTINCSAKEYEDNEFRNTLNEREKNTFDCIKNYKHLNREVALNFSTSLYYMESGKDLPEEQVQKQTEISALRSEIAFKTQHADADKILNYFKIDKQSLTQQALRHTKRQTVCELKDSSNFIRKKEAAHQIAHDLKGHYPFIKELGIDTKKLNTLIRIDNRKVFLDELNDAQKKEYLTVVEYKIIGKKASIAWKKIFSDKEKNKLSSDINIRKAQELTAKRDFLAANICKNKNTHAYLNKEHLELIKIKEHEKQHTARVKTIQETRQKKEGLLHQLEHRLSKMNRIEANTWHKNWDKLTAQINRVGNNNSLYANAIDASKSSLFSYTDKQKALLEHYELQANNLAQKPLINAYSNQKNSVAKKEYFDVSAVNDSLKSNPVEAYRAIFGEPKKVTSKEMRYSGGLIISLKGSKSGCWYDFSTGEGGNPIQAIVRVRTISFPEALKEGAALAGITHSTLNYPIKKQYKNLSVNDKEEEKNKIISAKSIIKGGVSIQGTLAEYYLKSHRKIEDPTRLNVLYWPKGVAWKAIDDNGALYDKINKIPALLVAAKNEKGELTGVQRIYLDEKTGGKNTFMDCAKLSKGKIENSAGVLQTGKRFGTLYVAEGPETGASIAMANPKATVLVAFGVSNIKNLGNIIKSYHPKDIIIAADNDSLANKNTEKTTLDALNQLKEEGINARIIMPKNMDNKEKTDWNDIHKSLGINEVIQQLGLEKIANEGAELSKIYRDIMDKKIDSCVSTFNEKSIKSERELSHLISEISDIKEVERSSSIKENTGNKIKEIQNNERLRNLITLDL